MIMDATTPSPLECSSDFFDDSFTDGSRDFLKALQELKSIRPQLYSAAEYCEKNYYCSEQKEKVVDDLKDYTVNALVNAVDHLGTVASNLANILEQQTSDISSAEQKLQGLNQKILTCRMVVDGEGLRQHQHSVSAPPKLHKRYVLPTSVGLKESSGIVAHRNTRQMYSKAAPSASSGVDPTPLSWFLESKQNPEMKTAKSDSVRPVAAKTSLVPSTCFHLSDTDKDLQRRIRAARSHGMVQHMVHKPEKGAGARSRLAAFFGKHRRV